jgi:diamine N-acetyltransferase
LSFGGVLDLTNERSCVVVQIRTAEIKDYEGIEKIAFENVKKHFEVLPQLFKLSETTIDKKVYDQVVTDKNSNYVILCACKDNEVVGFLLGEYQEVPESEDFIGMRYFYIRTLAVLEAMKRRGIGSLLFDYVKSYCKEKGISVIELDVYDFNQEAIKFYEKHGMSVLRTRMNLEII